MSATEERVEPGTSPHAVLQRQRRAFVEAGPPDVALRRNRIDRLLALVLDNTDAFVDAMAADFGTRSRAASLFTEVVGMIPVIEHTRAHVRQWMRATKLMRAMRPAGLCAEVEPAPLGVIGIIGPWNFPLNLVVLPAAAAFAAGNRVMIKMSEVTSRTADLMAALAPRYFDQTELAVVVGGPDVAAEFAALPFDHLFFTGSPAVGSLVQRAAAANLVPVTLELGGKNPVVIAPDADLHRSATRIARARMVNGGQVCVCPDYVFVPHSRIAEFVETVTATWQSMFAGIVDNDDYCSSVDPANFDRVVGLIEDARDRGATVRTVNPADEALPHRASRKIAPTLLTGSTIRWPSHPRRSSAPCCRFSVTPARTRSSPTSTPGRRRWSPTGSGPTGPASVTSWPTPAVAESLATTLPHRWFRRPHRSAVSGAAAWAPTTARPVSTRSVTTAPWWAPICRSA